MTSIKEARSWLRSEAKRADAFREIEAQLAEIGSLEKSIEGLGNQKRAAEKDLASVKDNIESHKADIKEVLKDADGKRKRILEDAQKDREEAKNYKASAAEIMADAEKAADHIRQVAEGQAKEIVDGRRGELAAINEEIEDLKHIRAAVVKDVAGLEKRRDQIAAQLDELRKKLG